MPCSQNRRSGRTQSLSRARRERARDDPKTTTETGIEKAAPVSKVGAGAGANSLSRAETIAAAELTAIKRTSIKALEMLTWAMVIFNKEMGL